MGKNFESARVRVRVPRRSWKSKGEVEAWAREQLAGGPPTLQAVIPKDHPESGKPATWKHVQDGVFADRIVLLVSDPPGLMVTDSETGERAFVASASRKGLILGQTKADEFITAVDEERRLRAFVNEENGIFSKTRQKHAEEGQSNWTLEWYHHGRRIKQFVQKHPDVSTERVWQELVKWGKGREGYGRHTHQDATYFHEWLGNVDDDHPVFSLKTTRIQHILRADRTKAGRDSLLHAIISGPLVNLSDDEFAWIVGKRTKNWPLDEDMRMEFTMLGNRIRQGKPLSETDRNRLAEILDLVRERRFRTKDADQGIEK